MQPPFGPYHLGEQTAAGLIRPVDAELDNLARRLAHYVGRIAMSDPDREAVARVARIVRDASDRVRQELD